MIMEPGVSWRRHRSCTGRTGSGETDARDAELLAHLLKLGGIVEVNVPSVEQEAARDLVRAREDARADLMRARHRVSKMLLRQGIVYSAGDAWTKVHDSWLRGQRFDQQSRQLAYDSAYEAMVLTVDRRDRLDRAIDEMATNSSYTPVVRRLGCLRGISTLTGFALAVEIGDWQRFRRCHHRRVRRAGAHRVLLR